jgi:hypothetical protein
VGWNVLALLDAAPAVFRSPRSFLRNSPFELASAGNTDGTFDYNSDYNPACEPAEPRARRHLPAEPVLSRRRPRRPEGDGGDQGDQRPLERQPDGDYTSTCPISAFRRPGQTAQNKGCAYGMYNAFKGLKLYGVNSLAAAPDWYAEYQDFLVLTQTSPTTTGGGNWGSMGFSCCYSSNAFTPPSPSSSSPRWR